jgi:hypothetical protein
MIGSASPPLSDWHPMKTYINGGTKLDTHEVRRYIFVGAVRPTPNQYVPYADQLNQVVQGYQPNIMPIMEEVRMTNLTLWSDAEYDELLYAFQHLPIEQLSVMPFEAVRNGIPPDFVVDAHYARLRGYDQVDGGLNNTRLCSAIVMRFAMEGIPYANFHIFASMVATSGFRLVRWVMLEDTSFAGTMVSAADQSSSFEMLLKARPVGIDFHMTRELTHPMFHDYLSLPKLGL